MQAVLKFEAVVELLMGDEEVAKELLKSYLLQTEEQMELLKNHPWLSVPIYSGKLHKVLHNILLSKKQILFLLLFSSQ